METRLINQVKISEDRTIYILDINFETLIIKYKNFGKLYETKLLEETNFLVKGQEISVLNAEGGERFHFPMYLLNPVNNLINDAIHYLEGMGYKLVKIKEDGK